MDLDTSVYTHIQTEGSCFSTGYCLMPHPALRVERGQSTSPLILTRLLSFCPSFPAGAFIPGVPVQPVLLRYPNEMVRMSSTPKQGVSVLHSYLQSAAVCYVSLFMKTLNSFFTVIFYPLSKPFCLLCLFPSLMNNTSPAIS